MTARSVPSSLAPIIEELELRQPKIVTKALLEEINAKLDIDQRPVDTAHRLQQHGWLLSLKTQDAWEFAPASRAGEIGSGDLFIELRATLSHRPNFRVAVAYESAAWLLDLARRAPERQVIAIPSSIAPPPALKGFRITHMLGRHKPTHIDELPVWRVETLIVLMGARPSAFRAWPTVMEWLSEAAQRVSGDTLLEELTGRTWPTWARAGYILEMGGRHDLGTRIKERIEPSGGGPFYLGNRKSPGRYSKRWDVRDSVLTLQID